jgi:hypothetical protein
MTATNTALLFVSGTVNVRIPERKRTENSPRVRYVGYTRSLICQSQCHSERHFKATLYSVCLVEVNPFESEKHFIHIPFFFCRIKNDSVVDILLEFGIFFCQVEGSLSLSLSYLAFVWVQVF